MTKRKYKRYLSKELNRLNEAIDAIESAQKVESGTTRKPAPDAGPIADAACDAEGM
jgi:hypothetical protein